MVVVARGREVVQRAASGQLPPRLRLEREANRIAQDCSTVEEGYRVAGSSSVPVNCGGVGFVLRLVVE